MELSYSKIFWFIISVALSIVSAIVGFHNSVHFAEKSSAVASTLSILVGVSLAISALFVSPPDNTLVGEERRRAKVSLSIDKNLMNGQNILFITYLIAILLALISDHWLGLNFDSKAPQENIPRPFSFFVAFYVGLSSFALLWSATLPSLLRGLTLLRSVDT